MSAELQPPALTSRPRTTRLVLSKGGRRVVALFVVLGFLAYVVPFVIGVIYGLRAADTTRKLDRYHAEVVNAFQSFSAETEACSGDLGCLHEANVQLAAKVERFQRQLGSLRFRQTALDSVSRVREDIAKIIAVVRVLASSASPAEYNRINPQLDLLLKRFDADYDALVQHLLGTRPS